MTGAELELAKKIGRHAWSRAWWLAGIQIVATALGIAAFKVIPKRYESTTTIRMEKGQLINPLTHGAAVSANIDDRIRGIREEVLSRDYFDKIIARLSLEPPNFPPVKHEELVQEMIKRTQITTTQRGADTFQVTYSGDDPNVVRDVTNLLAGIFVEESLSNKAGEAGSAVNFLQSQLEVYRAKLEGAEAALRSFEERNVEQLPSNRSAQLSRVDHLRATLMEVQGNLRQTKIQRDMLRRQALPAGSEVPDGVASEAVMVANPLQAQIQEKEVQLRRLLVDYSEAYPDVVALKTEIALLQQELARNPTVPVAQARPSSQPSMQDALSLGQLQQLEAQVGALQARETQLGQELARYERKLLGIPEVEQELARLKRDYDVNNDIYNNFLRRLEEAKVSKELEASKSGEVFRILQAAALPLTPSRPKRLPTVLMGVAAGLGLNALFLFLLVQLDTSFQSAEEVQKLLGLKVLAGIPRYRTKEQVSQLRLRAVALASMCVLYAGGLAAFLFWERVAYLLAKGN